MKQELLCIRVQSDSKKGLKAVHLIYESRISAASIFVSLVTAVLWVIPVIPKAFAAGPVFGAIEALQGEAQTVSVPKDRPVPARKGDEIRQGDSIATAAGSKAWIRFHPRGKGHKSLGESTSLEVKEMKQEGTSEQYHMNLRYGIARFVKKLRNTSPPSSYVITTPTAVIDLIPTDQATDFIVEVPTGAKTAVTVLCGKVTIANLAVDVKAERTVGTGYTAYIETGKPPNDPKKAGARQLEQLVARTTQPRTIPAPSDCLARVDPEAARLVAEASEKGDLGPEDKGRAKPKSDPSEDAESAASDQSDSSAGSPDTDAAGGTADSAPQPVCVPGQPCPKSASGDCQECGTDGVCAPKLCPDGKKTNEKCECVQCTETKDCSQANCEECTSDGKCVQKQCQGQKLNPMTCQCVNCIESWECNQAACEECSPDGNCIPMECVTPGWKASNKWASPEEQVDSIRPKGTCKCVECDSDDQCKGQSLACPVCRSNTCKDKRCEEEPNATGKILTNDCECAECDGNSDCPVGQKCILPDKINAKKVCVECTKDYECKQLHGNSCARCEKDGRCSWPECPKGCRVVVCSDCECYVSRAQSTKHPPVRPVYVSKPPAFADCGPCSRRVAYTGNREIDCRYLCRLGKRCVAGRCVGPQTSTSPKSVECQDGRLYNPRLRRCVKPQNPDPPIKKCPPGYRWDDNTCVPVQNFGLRNKFTYPRTNQLMRWKPRPQIHRQPAQPLKKQGL